MQRGRVRDLRLDDVVAELGDAKAVRALRGSCRSRSRTGPVGQREQFVVELHIREVESGHRLHGVERVVQRSGAAFRPAAEVVLSGTE